MTRYKHALAAASALLIGGSALAQAMDPRFPAPWPGYAQPEPQIYGNSGWTVDQAYGSNDGSGPAPGGLVLSDGRWALPAYPYAQYPRSRRDRDGDGVRNSRDRYPDDPRYR